MSFGNSSKVSLDLRGTRLSLEREALMELPESVLLCLFPNGVVLSPQRLPRSDGELDDEEDEDVYYVDVSLDHSIKVIISLISLERVVVRRTMPRVRSRILHDRTRQLLWITRRTSTRHVPHFTDRSIQHAKPTLPQTSHHRVT